MVSTMAGVYRASLQHAKMASGVAANGGYPGRGHKELAQVEQSIAE